MAKLLKELSQNINAGKRISIRLSINIIAETVG